MSILNRDGLKIVKARMRGKFRETGTLFSSTSGSVEGRV